MPVTFRARIAARAGEAVPPDMFLKSVEDRSNQPEPEHIVDAARYLESAGEQVAALTLWKRVVGPESELPLLRHVLRLALSLKDDEFVLELAARIRSAGRYDRNLIEIELTVLDRVSPSLAVSLLQQLISVDPQSQMSRYLRMRLTLLARRVGPPELVELDASNLPSLDEVEEYFCEPAIIAMKEANPTAAVEMAYRLVRRFPDSAGAYAAMIHALMPPPRTEPQIPPAAVVGADTAVRLMDVKNNERIAYVLEAESAPRSSLHEIGLDSPTAKALIGKHAGDEVFLSDNFGGSTLFRVEAVLHKWVFRFQQCLEEFPQKFPEEAFFKRIRVREDLPPEDGLGEFLALLTEMHLKRENAVEFYKKNTAMPIHMLAKAVGVPVTQAAEFAALSTGLGGIRCSSGAGDEAKRVDGLLSSTSAVVVDVSALSTLFMLSAYGGIPPEDIFSNWQWTGLVSEFALDALRQYRKTLEDAGERMGSVVVDGRVVPQITTEDELKRVADKKLPAIDAVLDAASAHLTLVPGSTLSAISAPLREGIVSALGRASAESIQIAKTRNAVLWSDDRVVNEVGHNEFGIQYAWTQAISRRLLVSDTDRFRSVSLRLLDLQYQGTLIDRADVIAAGELAAWHPDRYPLRAIIDQMACAHISADWVLHAGADAIHRAWSSPMLGFHAQQLTQRVLDRLGDRPDGPQLISALEQLLPVKFGLHVTATEHVRQMVRNWRVANLQGKIVLP